VGDVGDVGRAWLHFPPKAPRPKLASPHSPRCYSTAHAPTLRRRLTTGRRGGSPLARWLTGQRRATGAEQPGQGCATQLRNCETTARRATCDVGSAVRRGPLFGRHCFFFSPVQLLCPASWGFFPLLRTCSTVAQRLVSWYLHMAR